MRKTLLFILAFLYASLIFAQSNVYIVQENFDETTLPSGWVTMGNGVNNWYVSTSNIAGGKPNEAQLKWTPPFNGVSRLVSPSVDLSDVSSAVMTLRHYPSFFGANQAIVGVATSSDNGTTWNSVWSEQYNTNGQYTILETIESPDFGKDNVMFCIYFEGNSYAISDWYFDDFEVYTVESLGVELTSIDVPSIVNHGEHGISFTVRNTGSSKIESLKVRYIIDGETYEQTFNTDIPSMEYQQLTFEDKYLMQPDDSYNLQVKIITVNGEYDDEADNSLSVDIVSALGYTQMIPMIEHFSSSTCGPCVNVNYQMAALTVDHEGQYTYTKYTTNGPGLGDPYYTAEGGTRMTYYNVMGVPQTFLNGVDQGNAAVTEDSFVNAFESSAFANVRGSYTIEGNTINITADFMSYFDMENIRAFVTVNEKTTTENASSNGETEFHHVMMKMLENAEGNEITINAGEYQRLELSYDMSSTFVEEMDDLEVALWLQNYDTKEIYNSHFAYENSEHCHPVKDLLAIVGGDAPPTLYLSWNKPENGTPVGYDVYVDGELMADNLNDTYYSNEDEDICYNAKTAEVVAVYEDGKTSVGVAMIIVRDTNVEETTCGNISVYPNPANDVVKVSIVNGQQTTVMIYNVMGMLVETHYVTSATNTNEIEINISDYNPGVYFFDVNGEVVKVVVN